MFLYSYIRHLKCQTEQNCFLENLGELLKNIFFSNNLFLESSSKILKASMFAGNWFLFSTDSSMNAVNFIGWGTLSATQLGTIMPSNIKNWQEKTKSKWVKNQIGVLTLSETIFKCKN